MVPGVRAVISLANAEQGKGKSPELMLYTEGYISCYIQKVYSRNLLVLSWLLRLEITKQRLY